MTRFETIALAFALAVLVVLMLIPASPPEPAPSVNPWVVQCSDWSEVGPPQYQYHGKGECLEVGAKAKAGI